MKDNILNSWKENALEWNRILDDQAIPSRQITNKAILEQLLKSKAKKVIDIGCGEGWLVRSLTESGLTACGIDGTEELIRLACEKGTEQYACLSYQDIISHPEIIHEFQADTAVFNFCLYEKDSLQSLLSSVSDNLIGDKQIFIQTLHPFRLLELGLDYSSQWLDDSWKGLPGKFTLPHKWYARIMEDWITDIKEAGLQITSLIEPRSLKHPSPLSLILQAKLKK